MRQKPEIIASTTLAQTRLFRIEQLDLRFANGVNVQYERLVGSTAGAVLIVPLLDARTVLMIREYAAGMHRYELALPKGRIESGESTVDAANREIMEEIGYGAHRLQHIHSLTLAPGYVNHTTHIVLAQDLYPQRNTGDEPEEIEVVPWRLDRLPELLAQADCTEARSIAALFIVRDLILRNNS
ncbi:MAG: ADP compounds hydrolase NudE [Gammaproteobacteria bacterium]|nr:ADP compounds hydrolase NudE [Gammaproteobacteria bacterium]